MATFAGGRAAATFDVAVTGGAGRARAASAGRAGRATARGAGAVEEAVGTGGDTAGRAASATAGAAGGVSGAGGSAFDASSSRATGAGAAASSPGQSMRDMTVGATMAATPADTSTTSAAPTSARCRFVVTGGGDGGRRRTTAGGATSIAARTGATRGESNTRSDGARRVSGVMGDAATGVTARSRARHHPAASDCAMPGSARRAAVIAISAGYGRACRPSRSCASRNARIRSFAADAWSDDQPVAAS